VRSRSAVSNRCFPCKAAVLCGLLFSPKAIARRYSRSPAALRVSARSRTASHRPPGAAAAKRRRPQGRRRRGQLLEVWAGAQHQAARSPGDHTSSYAADSPRQRHARRNPSGPGIGTQALQEKGAECPFLPSCDRSCPNARTRARVARAIVTVGLGVMVIPVRVATSVPLGGT
jgi:hypothetical protein